MPDGNTPNNSPPSLELARQVDEVVVTDQQRAKFFELLRAEPTKGHVTALREVGVAGSRGQLRAFLEADQQLQIDMREAKGQNVEKLEAVRFEVALDKTHPAWEKANYTLLARLDPTYRPGGRLELTGADGGPVEVTNPDVAAALDRFANTIRRLAERAEPGGDVRPSDGARAELPAGDTRS